MLTSLIHSGGDGMTKPPTIDDKAFAAGAFTSTGAALIRLADAGKVDRRHDPYRNVKVSRYRSLT
jgi:hypothetical protein